jgi:hypothetical protein
MPSSLPGRTSTARGGSTSSRRRCAVASSGLACGTLRSITAGGPRSPSSIGSSREFSAIQRTLVLKHFGDVADPAALAAVDRAYEAFANGELARDVDLELFDCEPNSALYFLFAEFAFLAIEAGIDADFWSRLLPTLVRTQEIYATVYGPASGERTFASYKVRNRIPASRAPLPLARLESLRAAYSGLDVAKLDLEACAIARRAFRDQI